MRNDRVKSRGGLAQDTPEEQSIALQDVRYVSVKELANSDHPGISQMAKALDQAKPGAHILHRPGSTNRSVMRALMTLAIQK